MILLSRSSQLGSIAEVMALLVIFILILAAAYYVTKYFGKTMTGLRPGSKIHVIETVRIAPEKYLQIVEVTGRYFLLSVCKGNISLISELDKEEFPEMPVEDKILKTSFKDVFQKVIKK